MKILVVGGGGREHALCWKLADDSCGPELFCAPGNAGTASVATNLDIGAEDIAGLVAWADQNRPDLTVVGPEAPLCSGLTDMLTAKGMRVFGPSKAAAQMEGSKVFAKSIMADAGVPTGTARAFSDHEQALEYARSQEPPLVVKADGLAAGKGVYVCTTTGEVEQALHQIMIDRAFDEAGDMVLVEECLVGEEASILALVDGEHVVMLASSQDHKRVFNGDEGPNTGGMGAYSPAPVVTDDLWPVIHDRVLSPVLTELRRRDIIYKGVLYAGLMITADGPQVLEFNCRFGDPETQAILPRLAGDLVPALEACIDGTLDANMINWRPEACACVVMASGGYPDSYEKGKVVEGLAEAGALDGVNVLHAGTKLDGDRIITSGGRVLGVTALGTDLRTAVRQSYLAISKITFDQAQYRTDIAARALKR